MPPNCWKVCGSGATASKLARATMASTGRAMPLRASAATRGMAASSISHMAAWVQATIMPDATAAVRFWPFCSADSRRWSASTRPAASSARPYTRSSGSPMIRSLALA
ncbi:hypothetical protein D3C75_819070 [compost metagenome]